MAYEKQNKDGRVRSGRKNLLPPDEKRMQLWFWAETGKVMARGGREVVREALQPIFQQAFDQMPLFDPRDQPVGYEPREEVKELYLKVDADLDKLGGQDAAT